MILIGSSANVASDSDSGSFNAIVCIAPESFESDSLKALILIASEALILLNLIRRNHLVRNGGYLRCRIGYLTGDHNLSVVGLTFDVQIIQVFVLDFEAAGDDAGVGIDLGLGAPETGGTKVGSSLAPATGTDTSTVSITLPCASLTSTV